MIKKLQPKHKKQIGRPASANRLSFGSLPAAAKHLGCEPALLKAAKKAGCPAFRQSRIYVEELGVWLAENKPDPSAVQTKEDLQIRKLLAECIAKERENSVEDGKLVSVLEVQEINARMDSEIIASAQEIFVSDSLVKRLEGCSFAAIKQELTEALDKWMAAIHAPIRETS